MPYFLWYDDSNIAFFYAKGGGKVRICFHTHAFPDALAGRAMAVLSQNGLAFGYTPHTDGTLSGAESRLRAAGIDRALVLNIATNPRQEKKVNDFAIETANKGGFFFAAGSVHPDSTDPEGELIRLKENGVRGIKIHPDYAGVPITDACFDRIFSLCEALGLFVVTHAGPDPVSPNRVFAPPEAVLKVVSVHISAAPAWRTPSSKRWSEQTSVSIPRSPPPARGKRRRCIKYLKPTTRTGCCSAPTRRGRTPRRKSGLSKPRRCPKKPKKNSFSETPCGFSRRKKEENYDHCRSA